MFVVGAPFFVRFCHRHKSVSLRPNHNDGAEKTQNITDIPANSIDIFENLMGILTNITDILSFFRICSAFYVRGIRL